jgi:hypothetical protein
VSAACAQLRGTAQRKSRVRSRDATTPRARPRALPAHLRKDISFAPACRKVTKPMKHKLITSTVT